MLDQLKNAPPRLSDLAPDTLREALFDRKRAHDANWLASRERHPLTARIIRKILKSPLSLGRTPPAASNPAGAFEAGASQHRTHP